MWCVEMGITFNHLSMKNVYVWSRFDYVIETLSRGWKILLRVMYIVLFMWFDTYAITYFIFVVGAYVYVIAVFILSEGHMREWLVMVEWCTPLGEGVIYCIILRQ